MDGPILNSMEDRNVIIEIDEQIALLIEEINDSPSAQQQEDFAKACRDVVVETLMGPFGLTAAMFTDRDGGNITTVHNFEKGVYAPRDAERHQNYQEAQVERFDRSDYGKKLSGEREKIFDAEKRIEDAYTGRGLPKEESTHRDHVVSAHEIEKSSKGHLAQTREERVATANMDENKVWTDSGLNTSKNDKDLMDWSELPNSQDPSKTNAEFYGADPVKMKNVYDTAQKAVGREQSYAVLKKQSVEFVYEGSREAGKQALRQALGLLIKDLAEGLIEDVRTLMRDGFESLEQLSLLIKKRILETVERVKAKWAEYFKGGAAAGFAGFLSSFMTLVINSFITTAKNIVRIIREGCLSIVRALKMIFAPPPGVSKSEMVYEVFKILSGAMVVVLGIGMEEAIKKGIEMIPLLVPFAGQIAEVLTGILTGIASMTVILAFDRIKGIITFRNKQLTDVHRGQSIVLLKIKKSVLVLEQTRSYIDVSSSRILEEFHKDWEEIQNLKVKTTEKIDSYTASIDNLLNLAEEI